MNATAIYEREAGDLRAYVYREDTGYSIFGWIGSRINVGWYAPTLKEARKLADAIIGATK